MLKVNLGNTGLVVSKTAIGTVPFQRLNFDDSVRLLRRCYDGGVTYFDTSDNYGGSDSKLGAAFEGIRDKIVISTKISGTGYEKAWQSIKNSLAALGTDYIDLIQFHNPDIIQTVESGEYIAATEAKAAGLVRHIGFTNHNLERALEAAQSGLFETIQYPLSFLSTARDEELITLCSEKNLGLIAMKPFAGGVIREPELPFWYFRRHANVVPIYGIQRESELDALLALENGDMPPEAEINRRLEDGRQRYKNRFCRGCGCCEGACPHDIDVSYASRLGDFFYRNPPEKYKGDSWRKLIEKVELCENCGACTKACPYGLALQTAMQESLKTYRMFAAQWTD